MLFDSPSVRTKFACWMSNDMYGSLVWATSQLQVLLHTHTHTHAHTHTCTHTHTHTSAHTHTHINTRTHTHTHTNTHTRTHTHTHTKHKHTHTHTNTHTPLTAHRAGKKGNGGSGWMTGLCTLWPPTSTAHSVRPCMPWTTSPLWATSAALSKWQPSTLERLPCASWVAASRRSKCSSHT